MFFAIFSERPVLSMQWDTRHLWAVECLIASVIKGDYSDYVTICKEDALCLRLQRDVQELLAHSEPKHLFLNEQFLAECLDYMPAFIAGEISSIAKALAVTDYDSVRPLRESLVNAIRNDKAFADYLSQSGCLGTWSDEE